MTTGQPPDESPDQPTRAGPDPRAETPVDPPDEPGTTGATETTGSGEGGAGADDTVVEEDAGEADEDAGEADEDAGEAGSGRRGRVRPLRRMQRFAARLVRSRRGLLLLILMIGGTGAIVMFGGMVAADYSETPAFCGRCHTMDPELKAFNASAHSEVACAECHVEPGISGTVKAKIKGTRQLIEVMTGTFPKPIPPPDHTELPAVKDTCLRCHSLEKITSNEGPVGLVLRPTYRTDEKNTRELVAVVLRPLGLGGESGVQGVHWHVQQKVTFASSDPQSRTIGLVEITRPDGGVEQYISSSDVTLSSDVRPDISRLKGNERVRTMDCLDCHNRVGHPVPSVDQALDKALASGRIATDLPYIKKAAKALLNNNYSSVSVAYRAIDGLRDTYRTQYPTAGYDEVKLVQAVDEIKRIYSTLATPQMKVAATTYPDNLGHQEGAGCFRCHDGAHYKVVNGKVSTETIPSKCSTCHTFPQIGGSISVVPLAGQPASHSDTLYVFTHKNTATSSDPSSQSCGTCHDKSYCQNCHDSGVAKVTHDEMLYNHAAVIRRVGGPACAQCHQAIYCATCHSGRVLQAKPG